MRILYGHCYTPAAHFGVDWIEAWLKRLRNAGIDVHPIQLGLPVPGRRLTFRELEGRWRRGDRALMTLYESVARAVENADVLINAGALNLHPEFLKELSVKTVLSFNDDPESSSASRPVAPYHDLCMIGNIAEVETYRSWGVRNVEWWPMGFRADDFDPNLKASGIVDRERAVDVTLLCERLTPYRRANVDQFALSFPQGEYFGAGWPKGFLPEHDRIPLLQKTKIGINIHNSTGPINFRTYYLPANGVMQICDNKHHLAGIFEVGEEVIGYDTMDEAVELCRYYLSRDEERREIALAGWRRALRDYNEVSVFERLVDAAGRLRKFENAPVNSLPPLLERHIRDTRYRRALHRFALPITRPIGGLLRLTRGGQRRLMRSWHNRRYRLMAEKVADRQARRP